jgi:hypothetical protein
VAISRIPWILYTILSPWGSLGSYKEPISVIGFYDTLGPPISKSALSGSMTSHCLRTLGNRSKQHMVSATQTKNRQCNKTIYRAVGKVICIRPFCAPGFLWWSFTELKTVIFDWLNMIGCVERVNSCKTDSTTASMFKLQTPYLVPRTWQLLP